MLELELDFLVRDGDTIEVGKQVLRAKKLGDRSGSRPDSSLIWDSGWI